MNKSEDEGIELRTFDDRNDENPQHNNNFYGNGNYSDGDGDEVTGLVTSERLYRDEDDDDDDDRICSGSFLLLSKAMICVLVVASAPLLFGFFSDRLSGIPIAYECPAHISETQREDPPFEDAFESQELLAENMTEFLQNFRHSKFDNWRKTYRTVKREMTPWKSKYFVQYLKNGDTIYESACGMGLNLFMTLEILEEHGIKNLVVYGNEYIELSAQKANLVFDNIAPAQSKKGVICEGDSTDLSFVPSDSFDLVYTGYITPMVDPLHFNWGETLKENYERYRELCEAVETDWQGQALSELAQKQQDNWYGKWVGEMARIAKPGAPVIVEQISSPYCEAYFDWGGVKKSWWKEAAVKNTYSWNVDPGSLEIGDDTLFKDRYHVFMLKEVNVKK